MDTAAAAGRNTSTAAFLAAEDTQIRVSARVLRSRGSHTKEQRRGRTVTEFRVDWPMAGTPPVVQPTRRISSEPVSSGGKSAAGDDTPLRRQRKMSVLRHRTSTVAGIQGDSGAVIPESLDMRNEGRAQLMVRITQHYPASLRVPRWLCSA